MRTSLCLPETAVIAQVEVGQHTNVSFPSLDTQPTARSSLHYSCSNGLAEFIEPCANRRIV